MIDIGRQFDLTNEMKTYIYKIVFSFAIISKTNCDTTYSDTSASASGDGTHRDGRQYGGGHGAVSSGYGAPSGGYGAPAAEYGAPASGGSSYAAPCDSYGCGSSAPVYVYQQGQGQQQTGNAAGALAALLPLGALALLVPLGLLAFGAIFPTTTVVGRRKRSTDIYNATVQDQQAMMLQDYMETLANLPELNLHKDMVAKYLECGAGGSDDSPSLHGCLQKLSCIMYDETAIITDTEREVANIVVESILGNEYVNKSLKKRLLLAGKKGARYPGSCNLYKCNHHLLPQ